MTPEKLTQITKMIRSGIDYHTACAAAEILEEDAIESLNDKKVINAVRIAYAQCKVLLIQEINKNGGAKGAQYLLERLFPLDNMRLSEKPKMIAHEAESDEIFDPLIESDLDIPL